MKHAWLHAFDRKYRTLCACPRSWLNYHHDTVDASKRHRRALWVELAAVSLKINACNTRGTHSAKMACVWSVLSSVEYILQRVCTRVGSRSCVTLLSIFVDAYAMMIARRQSLPYPVDATNQACIVCASLLLVLRTAC